MPRTLSGLLLSLLLIPAVALAQVPAGPDAQEALAGQYTGKAYSPYAQRNFPSHVY